MLPEIWTIRRLRRVFPIENFKYLTWHESALPLNQSPYKGLINSLYYFHGEDINRVCKGLPADLLHPLVVFENGAVFPIPFSWTKDAKNLIAESLDRWIR